MVDAELGRDLMSFGVPLLVLGDPAQLPPIQGGGFFTEAEPDAMLTEVHRQAQDDPIVRLSMDIRAGNRLEPGDYGDTQVVRATTLDPQRVLDADQVLVGRNATRRAYNIAHARAPRLRRRAADRRRQAGLPAQQPPQGPVQRRPLDGQGTARAAREQILTHAAQAGRRRRRPGREGLGAAGMLHRRRSRSCRWPQRKKYDEFDFGYVLTVHKAQGSQWDDVVLFDESFAFPDSRDRWLYTGVTRAAKRLTVVVGLVARIERSERRDRPAPGFAALNPGHEN